MRPINKYYIFFFKISLIILYVFNTAYASDNEKEKEPEKQYQHYEDIKRKQNQDYKKGVYKDEKKDYVNKWISEDINFQKRVIKLKSDYLEWANERQAAGKEVKFKEYEPLKNFTGAEKDILLEYHNRFFTNKDKEKVNVKKSIEGKKTKKVKQKKAIEQKNVIKTESKSQRKEVSSEEINEKDISAEISSAKNPAGMETGNNIYIYMIVGFALILIAVECLYLIVKRFQ